MGIFDGIEKLINEHGSAKILGERLLLAKDQNAAQEKRISELDAQFKQAQTDIATLRLQLQSCQEENERTKQEIQKIKYCECCPPGERQPLSRTGGTSKRDFYVCPKTNQYYSIRRER
jgi:outer membrane murein-binding lipoprotein Lpp